MNILDRPRKARATGSSSRTRTTVVTRPFREGTSAAAHEIAPDVYCLGPKGRTQTDVYLVRSGASWALIDTGWAKDGPAIKQAAEALFGADTPPVAILLTHDHPDHAGSALHLARVWDCPVYVHPDELPIATGDFAAITRYAGPLDTWVILPLMHAMGRRRREAMLSGSSLKDVARAFDAGAEVPGLPGWVWVHTPGHTPGHVSFFRPSDRVLITGDAVVTLTLNSVQGLLQQKQGLSGPPWYTTWSWPTAKASVATLARLEPKVLAGGHGTPLNDADTATALRAFADRFSGGSTTGGATAGGQPHENREREPSVGPLGRMKGSPGRVVMSERIGLVMLVLSGMGFPLTQLAIRRFGRRGALIVEAACTGLLVRDAAMLATGAPSRLRRGPAVLLWLEAAAGTAAVLTGLRPLVDAGARASDVQTRPSIFEAVRRTAVGALFGLHTLRFRIYLQPDHGLRDAR